MCRESRGYVPLSSCMTDLCFFSVIVNEAYGFLSETANSESLSFTGPPVMVDNYDLNASLGRVIVLAVRMPSLSQARRENMSQQCNHRSCAKTSTGHRLGSLWNSSWAWWVRVFEQALCMSKSVAVKEWSHHLQEVASYIYALVGYSRCSTYCQACADIRTKLTEQVHAQIPFSTNECSDMFVSKIQGATQ